MRRVGSHRSRAATALAAAVLVTTTVTAIALTSALIQRPGPAGSGGHPTAETPRPDSGPIPPELEAARGASTLPPDFEVPPLSPLATGRYVNFEPRPVKPIALTANGWRLYVANTPNDTLTVIPLIKDIPPFDIPVGIGPVTVAIQPGTDDNIVWVANNISDNVSVVNVAARRVVGVIQVGDEPAGITFDEAGDHAFVVIHGVVDTPDGVPTPTVPNIVDGHLVVIDTVSRQVVSNTYLDCNTPEDVVYDPIAQRVCVTAFHSGNNTTVVGRPALMDFIFPPPTNPPPVVPPPVNLGLACSSGLPNCFVLFPDLWVAQIFSPTAGIFANARELSPWPDLVTTNGPTTNGIPPVHRIVPDLNAPVSSNGWSNIIAVLSSNGLPDPDMVQLMNNEFGIRNAAQVITMMIDEYIDTRDNDLICLDASNPADPGGLPIASVLGNVGTMLTGLAQRPGGGLLVTNIEALNRIRLEPNLKGHFADHELVVIGNSTIPPTITARDLHAGIPNFHNVSSFNQLAWENSLANPADVIVHPSGNVAYVAANGTNRVGVVEIATGRVLGIVDVAAGPTGLALDAPAAFLYVMSRVDNCVTVVDVSSDASPWVREVLCLFNPEPQTIQYGRQFLYTALQAHNGAHACSTCHPTGRLDHVAWDLGNPAGGPLPVPPNMTGTSHPLKGPMVTQSLEGLKDHAPLHWRGDKPTFQDFNGAFEALIGGVQLSPADMDAYAAFIDTVVYPPSPFYNRTNSYKDPRSLDGIDEYFAFCNGCHNVGHDAAFFTSNGDGGINLSGPPFFAQAQLVTQLRGIYRKLHSDEFNGVGLIHDGRDRSLQTGSPLMDFLEEFFANTPSVTLQDKLDMAAFITATQANVMSVVGWQILIAPPVPFGSPPLVDLATMIAQFDKQPSHCDVIAKGIVGGLQRSYYLVTTMPTPTFQSDTDQLITQSALIGSLGPGDSLVFTAWPPGSGPRAIDQDLDCLSDGLDPMPQFNNTGDANFDTKVDLFDFAAMQECFTGAGGGPAGPGCETMDSDCDGDVDLTDYGVMHQKLTGPTG